MRTQPKRKVKRDSSAFRFVGYCSPDETSVWAPCDESVMEVKVEDFAASVPAPSAAKFRKHTFVSKTVQTSEDECHGLGCV